MCCDEDVSPDNYTSASLFKICSEIGDLGVGEMIHCWSLRMGFLSDTVLANSLMAMYSKCGSFSDVRKVFDEIPQRSSASWNVLLSGFVVSGNYAFNEDTWKLVKQMQVEGVKLDAFTVSSLLPLCGFGTGKWDHGREIHCVIIKGEMNVDSDVHVGSCLIDMYSKRKNVIMGRQIFDRMKCRNVVAWTSMIALYAQNGCSDKALMLFREMQLRDGMEPNRISLISILPACNSLGVLMQGKQIHGYAIRKEYYLEVSLLNALIDMYSKCGGLNIARRVFDNDSYCKDTISWCSMISGYGVNGKGGEAILLYKKMIQSGIKPNNITLVSVLSGCARSGMVTEGLDIYSSAINDHGILPTVEICSCMVDMLARSGQINRALEFIKTMPVKPNPSLWGSLSGASALHGNVDVQELAYKSLIQLEPENPSNYVALSNLYASLKRWDVVAELRRKMKGKGLKKLSGCSWISISNQTHSFSVADKTHPCSPLIYEMLNDLIVIMKGSGNVPDMEGLM
ncbi:Pentatricopeptide repeat-containing protein [Thalictrum thalictroides]|uniref:Pentatricopeptide repeat-containing protein n=1 Tax=Thalictrum thalictroides TaxID=46969 RepID=A0A7J6X0L0_THATH|nr:Pentatricopeptide repeat-containing protein [Thalictrum thalictroides]